MSNFKVGDWIKIGDTVQQITAINPENDYNITCDMVETTDDYVSIESIEPWYPKEGEWCWFDKNKLGKFWKKQGTRNYWTLSEFKNISEKTRIPSGDYFVSDYCEPFIGQLPSFIKDKQ